MEQILLHLVGDYITQTDWMAENKTKKTGAALLHAAVYSLPFLLLTDSMMAIAAIFGTHAVIDRFRLARYVIFAKNKLQSWDLQWSDCSGTGYHKDRPAWLAVWLMIIADNTMHLCINYASIRWL